MSEKARRKILLSVLLCIIAFFLLWRVNLSSGSIFKAAKNISVVVQQDELRKLDGLPFLEHADLSGSTCYEEIINWGKQNPDVELRYTVELPDGQLIGSDEEAVKLSFKDSSDFDDTAHCLKYLPNIKTAELCCDIETFRLEAHRIFSEQRPDINYDFSFSIDGKSCSTSDKELIFDRVGPYDAQKLIQLLPSMPNLIKLDLGNAANSPRLSFTDIALMEQERPDVEFLFEFDIYGRHFSINDTEMDLNHIRVEDEGKMVKEAIACMPKLGFLDMDSCGVSDEAMADIRDTYPDVKVVWRVWFGRNYSVRTDVETILASMPSKGGNIYSRNCQSIKYCTDVKYLDLGHNEILDDISFVSYMPRLEVAILAMATWSDASPLADCPELEYLEIQTTEITDLSPLATLKKLKHLNICYLYGLEDISPLYNLPQLERLWIGCLDPVPAEQIEKMQSIAPDCIINTTTYDPTDGGWRYLSDSQGGVNGLAPRYALLREQFKYDKGLANYAFIWNDPKY